MTRRLLCLRAGVLAGMASMMLTATRDAFPEEPLLRAPPRSVSDIVRHFSEANRDGREIARLEAEIAAEPPVSAYAAEKIDFHRRRKEAARRIGDHRTLLSDLQELNKLYAGSDLGITNELASALHLAGRKQEATRLREQATRDATASVHWRTTNEAVLSGYYAEEGEFDRARAYLQRAEEVFQARRSRWGGGASLHFITATIEFYRGELHTYGGNLEQAEAAYRRSLAADAEAVKIEPTGQAKYNTTTRQTFLARTLLRLNRFAEAEYYAREALHRSATDTGDYSLATARSLVFLAGVLMETGRLDEVGQLAKLAIRIFEGFDATSASYVVARAREMLGEVLVANNSMEEADAVFGRRAAALQSDAAAARMEAAGSVEWSYALVWMGRAPAALAMLRGLARGYEERSGVDSMDYGAIRCFEAIALAATGERKGALELFHAFVPKLVEKTFADSAAEGVSFRASLRLQRVVDAYMALIAEIAASSPELSASLIGEAFSLADIARGSSVQRALTAASARATIGNPRLAELARREQDLANRVVSLSRILADLHSRTAEQQLPNVQTGLRRDIEAMKAERVVLRSEILKQFPEYSELVSPRPVSVAQVQAQLAPGEAVVSIYATSESTYVWAIPQSGPPSFVDTKLGAKQLASLVETLRRALDVGDASLERFPRFDIAAAHDLYNALLKPVEGALGAARSLIVVPHGALAQIPFALLVTEPAQPKVDATLFAEYRGVPFMLRKYAISQLPSVGTLVTLRRAARPAAASRPFAGFGDPVFRESQLKEVGESTGRRMRFRNLAVGRVDARGAPTVSNEMGNLSALPDTADEIRDIAAVLGADSSRDVFLKAAATETNLRKQDLLDRRVIVFATHGLVAGDLNGLTQPALALSNPTVTGEREVDGLLTMEEVLGLKLNADWIVLSACNTAAADGKGNEAVSGLGRAFFFAGARALLVSNWAVETGSARHITTNLFRRLAGDAKLSRTEALQRTLVDIIDTGTVIGSDGKALYSYAHPMFWAPFSLIGEGGAR